MASIISCFHFDFNKMLAQFLKHFQNIYIKFICPYPELNIIIILIKATNHQKMGVSVDVCSLVSISKADLIA